MSPGKKYTRRYSICPIYEKVNSIRNKISKNDKVKKAKEIHNKFEVNIAAYYEHRLNMQDRENINWFNQLFKGEKTSIQSVVAHSIHKNFGRVQEGEMFLLAFGTITEYLA
jgi:hypothetical protein